MHQTVFRNNFLEVRENQGYFYYHISRSSGQLVAILPYRVTEQVYEYLARSEICPAHSLQTNLYSITGGVKEDENILKAARRELLEESGYKAEHHELQSLETIRPSKQSDTLMHLFAVDVSAKQQGVIAGDGTVWEEDASVEWLSYTEAMKIDDPSFITMIARLRSEKWQ